MNKKILDQRYSPYQMPAVIIGSITNGKPNFMLCTWVSRLNRSPPVWMASINRKHLTIEGIQESRIFSMNFPSSEMVTVTDYIGITSGRLKDKSKIFDVFYGETKAPMVAECPLNMELQVTEIVDLPDHFIVMGEAITTYIDEQYCTEGKPDMKKMNPIIYTGIEKEPTYWTIGDKIADAFKKGKEYNESSD
ncbi:MAG: flavin reductase family protein [Asgard group archaeon]|nr:flavin reductase family protein [Asgard group archaeon]